MANLERSTRLADSVRPDCLCLRKCDNKACRHYGRWHNHADEVCQIHPDTVVES